MNTITVTGPDGKTDIEALAALDAEIGFLYSVTPEGRNRYPSKAWIKKASRLTKRCALHVCGSARKELLTGQLSCTLENFQRVQVNGFLFVDEVERFCRTYPTIQFITQHNPKNLALLTVKATNHSILVDNSGGRGISPGEWHRPYTDKVVGFAGGLGPDNLASQMEIFRGLAAGEPFWVDMEGKLRVDDFFSIEKAREVIAIFKSNL